MQPVDGERGSSAHKRIMALELDTCNSSFSEGIGTAFYRSRVLLRRFFFIEAENKHILV